MIFFVFLRMQNLAKQKLNCKDKILQIGQNLSKKFPFIKINMNLIEKNNEQNCNENNIILNHFSFQVYDENFKINENFDKVLAKEALEIWKKDVPCRFFGIEQNFKILEKLQKTKLMLFDVNYLLWDGDIAILENSIQLQESFGQKILKSNKNGKQLNLQPEIIPFLHCMTNLIPDIKFGLIQNTKHENLIRDALIELELLKYFNDEKYIRIEDTDNNKLFYLHNIRHDGHIYFKYTLYFAHEFDQVNEIQELLTEDRVIFFQNGFNLQWMYQP